MENLDVSIRQIIYDSREYNEELELRNKVLRLPLGLNIYEEDHSWEEDSYHIGAFIREKLVGISIFVKLNHEDIRMRQVAVDESLRGFGIGRKLIEFGEYFVKEKGYKKIIMDARKTAWVFYEKLGYKKEGEEFLELGIPHIKMYKVLS